MKPELAPTYRQQIFERHQESKEADQVLRRVVLENIEAKRQTGQLIADAKGDLHDGDFSNATNFLSDDSIKSYLRFARQNPNPITDLAEALRAIESALTMTGTLPSSNGHGEQKLHEPNFYSKAIALSQTLLSQYRHYLQRQPMSAWRSEQINGLLASLYPISAIINDLSNELDSRGEL